MSLLNSSKKPKAKGSSTNVQARYDAAGTGRRIKGWNPPSVGPNRALTNIGTVRSRSRDIIRNEWAGASSIRTWIVNLIGTGIIPRPLTKIKALKQKLTRLWSEWVKVADADGVLDFYGLQALIVRAWFEGGEAFVRLRPRRVEDGLIVPLQLQVLESEQLPNLDADVWPGMPAGNMIRSGIELNRIGRRTAYWFYRSHPGDTPPANISATDLVRVPADGVLHIYEPLRPGQLRGVSQLTQIITRLRGVADFDDAVLERQRLANLFTTFFVRPMPSGGEDPITGGAVEYGKSNEPISALEPGMSQELLPGEDVRFSDPPDAGANYADFMRFQHLGVSAGGGVPYEFLTGDLKDVSDRTLRIAINEYRRGCEQKQWLVIIPKLCTPVRDAWALAAMMAGELTADEAVEARDVRWSPQGWGYVHPVQDVQAKAAEVEAGFRSRSQIIGEMGYDPEDVDDERAEDKARAERLGLAFPPVDPNKPVDPSQEEEANAERTKAEARLLDAKAARERDEAAASVRLSAAKVKQVDAEAALASALRDQADAEKTAAKAKHDLACAEVDLMRAEAALKSAIAQRESDERVAAMQKDVELAHIESAARVRALDAAELHAVEMRAAAREIEMNKVAVSRLEVEAAQVGLAELRGE